MVPQGPLIVQRHLPCCSLWLSAVTTGTGEGLSLACGPWGTSQACTHRQHGRGRGLVGGPQGGQSPVSFPPAASEPQKEVSLPCVSQHLSTVRMDFKWGSLTVYTGWPFISSRCS